MSAASQQELRRALVAELRSSRCKQIRHALRRGEYFCASGVACHVFDPTLWRGPYHRPRYAESPVSFAPDYVARAFGLDLVEIAADNDRGASFEQIADRIESGRYDRRQA